MEADRGPGMILVLVLAAIVIAAGVLTYYTTPVIAIAPDTVAIHCRREVAEYLLRLVQAQSGVEQALTECRDLVIRLCSDYDLPADTDITEMADVIAAKVDGFGLVARVAELEEEREAAIRYMTGRGVMRSYPRSDEDEPLVMRNLTGMIVGLEERCTREVREACARAAETEATKHYPANAWHHRGPDDE